MASGYYRYIGTIVGGVVGSIIPGVGTAAGIVLGSAIGGILGSVIDVVTAPKPKDMSEPQIQDNLAITSAALGTFIPIIRGRQIVHGNIIDATLKQPHVIEQDTGGGGGKGGFGGQSQVSRTVTYSISLVIALCQGPITSIFKAWTDATLVYDSGLQGSINTIAIVQPGSGYIVGDIVTLVGGNNDANMFIDAVTGGGGVTSAFFATSNGTGYGVGQVLGVTGGSGTGFAVQVTDIVHHSVINLHLFADSGAKPGAQSQNGCTDFHVHQGTEDQLACSILEDIHGVGNVQAYRGLAYVVIKDLDLGTSGRVPQFQFEVESANSNVLSDVVTDLCVQAGLTTDLINVSLIPVRHVDMLITSVTAVSNILESLAVSYNFIGVESDGKIKFRGKSVNTATTIPERLLSAGIDKQNTTSLSVTRIQDRELPTQVTINYPDKTRNYQSGAQIQQLVNSLFPTDSLFQMNVPVALLPADAKILAESVLYEAWSSRESFTFTLPPRYKILEPGDAINVAARGLEYSMRITEWTDGDNWLIECKGVSYDASIHKGFRPIPGVSGEAAVALPATARASAALIEPPALSSSEQEPRWLFAAYATDTAKTFISASLFESLDGGASFNFARTASIPAIVGVAPTALPTANWYIWDHTNTLTVVLYQRGLQSVSEQQVLDGNNWAMLGGELLGFREATLIGPRTYTLSHFLRGRKGTESFVGTHVPGELFILITPDLRANESVIYPRARIAVPESYKVLDPITNITAAPIFTFTPSGVSVKPWAPFPQAILHGTPSTNDLTIRWLYRSRTLGEFINNSGIGWDLDFTRQFQVLIYTNNTYTTVVRTFTTVVFTDANAVLSQVYTAAQQTADFGSPQATIYVDIIPIGTGILGYAARTSG